MLEHNDEWLSVHQPDMNSERAERLRDMYEAELMRCASSGTTSINWKEFLDYADKKEVGKSNVSSI